MKTKRCRKCCEEKELNEENFPKNYSYKDGWNSMCKKCFNSYQNDLMKKLYHQRKEQLGKKID